MHSMSLHRNYKIYFLMTVPKEKYFMSTSVNIIKLWCSHFWVTRKMLVQKISRVIVYFKFIVNYITFKVFWKPTLKIPHSISSCFFMTLHMLSSSVIIITKIWTWIFFKIWLRCYIVSIYLFPCKRLLKSSCERSITVKYVWYSPFSYDWFWKIN